MGTWQEWLTEQRTKSTMTVSEVSLAGVSGWGMQGDGESFGRGDGRFFSLVGVRVEVPQGREVTAWAQPLIKEVGDGAVAVLKSTGADRYLIAAKKEPGNSTRPGCLLLSAPLSASRSNLEQAHGGKRPPRAEFTDGYEGWVEIPQDGGRFFGKKNRYAVIEVDPASVTLRDDERWFTRDELREAVHAGELNEHLIQALALAFF